MSDKKQSKKSHPSTSVPGSPMDIGLLQQMVQLMAANDLNTVDVRDGVRRVILKRGVQAVTVAPMATGPLATAGSAVPQAPAAPPEDANLISIKSPMVGTFYSAPGPDAAPFLAVGTTVSDDTDVCIIEAMKVFNNIKAECRGTVVKVLAQNGQSVEFGQVLFLVKPH